MSKHDASDQPSAIEVSAHHEEDVAADRVDLFVDVEGSSLFTGRAALSKAREVHQLVNELALVGIPEDQIFIESVRATTTSGIFSKSSSARYSLRVHCRSIERLGDVLGAIASQKNVSMNQMDWGYDESPTASARRLGACAAIAKEKARAIADALGVRLGAPYRICEVVPRAEPGPPSAIMPSFAGVARARASMSQDDLGLSVSHHRKIVTRISASFRVVSETDGTGA
jgi:uncharacterized protein YggE